MTDLVDIVAYAKEAIAWKTAMEEADKAQSAIPDRTPASAAQQMQQQMQQYAQMTRVPQTLNGRSPNKIRPASPATSRLIAFIDAAVGPMASLYAELIMVSLRLLPRLLNAKGFLNRDITIGSFYNHGSAVDEFVIVRFMTPKGHTSPVEAVYRIPESIMEELAAEDVAVALTAD